MSGSEGVGWSEWVGGREGVSEGVGWSGLEGGI